MPSRRQVLLVLFMGVLMSSLDVAIVGPALPSMQETFAVGQRALAWTISIYILLNITGTPLLSKLSDLSGRRLVFIMAVGLFALGSTIVALAWSFPVLLCGRALQGLASGGIFPIAVAVIGEAFPPEKRGTALGLLGAVYGIAFLIGPALGGLLLRWDWRLLFLINIPISVWVIHAALRRLPASERRTGRAFDFKGMLVLSSLLLAMTLGLEKIEPSQFLSSLASFPSGPLLLMATALTFLFWLVERDRSDPILPVRLLGSRQTGLASFFAILAGLFQGVLVFVPSYLVEAFGVTHSSASFMLVPVVAFLGLGAPAAGRLLDALGSRVVISGGATLVAVGMALIGFFGQSLTGFYTGASLVGLGLASLVGAPLRYIFLNEASEEDRTAAQAAIGLLTRTGLMIGTVLMGVFVESASGQVAGYRAGFLCSAGAACLLLLLTPALKRRQEEIVRMAEQRDGVG